VPCSLHERQLPIHAFDTECCTYVCVLEFADVEGMLKQSKHDGTSCYLAHIPIYHMALNVSISDSPVPRTHVRARTILRLTWSAHMLADSNNMSTCRRRKLLKHCFPTSSSLGHLHTANSHNPHTHNPHTQHPSTYLHTSTDKHISAHRRTHAYIPHKLSVPISSTSQRFKMQRARKAWDSMSNEQRETQAGAMSSSLALREKLSVLQQLHDELVEDAIELQKGASQLDDKLRRRVLPLLDECETGLRRVKDELRLERETADTLAGLLRDTTRALLEAPIESVKMVKRRVPSMYARALTRWINEAQGSGIDLDTVFHEVKKIRKSSSTEDDSKDKGVKRKRTETSDDHDDDVSERVGEGPSGETRIHIRDLSDRVNGGGGAGIHHSLG
jgi:hypothetical protein